MIRCGRYCALFLLLHALMEQVQIYNFVEVDQISERDTKLELTQRIHDNQGKEGHLPSQEGRGVCVTLC